MEKRRTMGTGLVVFVLLCLAFSFTSVAQAAQSSTISVSPASLQKSQGDTFTIEIAVDPKGAEIYAVQYDLYFDNKLLNASSQTPGSFLSLDGTNTIEVRNVINNSIGKIEYGETRTGKIGITNSGVVASISFEVVGASGTSDLKLGDVILSNSNGESIETGISGGTCTVGKVTGEPAVTDITVEEAHKMQEEKPAGIIFLDVQTEREYKEGYILDAINIPLAELESRIGELDDSKEIIVYCRSGSISRTASERLVQNGFKKVSNMLGGLNEWKMYFTVIKSTSMDATTPSLALSSSPSPSLAVSPIVSLTPVPTTTPVTGGFKVVFAIMGLLGMSYLVIKKRKERG